MRSSVELVSYVDGVRQDSKRVGHMAIVQPGSFFGLRRDPASLLILTDPPSGFNCDVNRLVVQAVTSTYLRESAGSVTSRLARALREANRALCDENSTTVTSQRHYLSILCATITAEEAFFAQVGPSIIVLIRDGDLQRLGEKSASTLSSECIGREFGFEVHYSRAKLEPGDILLLSSPGLARITNRVQLLSSLPDRDRLSPGDRLFKLCEDAPNQVNLSAITVNCQTSSKAHSHREAVPVSTAAIAPQSEPEAGNPPSIERFSFQSEETLAARGQELAVPVSSRSAGSRDRPESHSSPLPSSDGGMYPSNGRMYPEWKAPSSRERQKADPPSPIRDVVIEFKGTKADAGLVAGTLPAPIGTDAIGDRVAAAAQGTLSHLFHCLVWVQRIALTLLLPALMLAILATLGFVFLRGYQIEEQKELPTRRPIIEEALQIERDALATRDVSLKRRLLSQAASIVSSTSAASPNDRETSAAGARIRSELDQINGITRLSSFNTLVDLSRDVASGEALDLQMQGIDVYALDRDGGRVFKFLLDGSGNQIQPNGGAILMRKGDTYGGSVVNNPIAMTWVPAGGARSRGVLAVLDSGGTSFEYDPTKGISPMRFANADLLNRRPPVAGHAGNLYALDSQKGKLQWYQPQQAGYGETPYNYFNPDTPVELSSAIDFTMDGSLYLLHRNGRIQKFFAGKPQPFEVVLPDTPLKTPNSTFTSANSRYLYIVDAGNGRVVQLSKEGTFERQFQYSGPEDVLRGAKRISVDEKRGILYALTGKRVVTLSLETRQP